MKRKVITVACGLAILLAVGLSVVAIGQAFADSCLNCTQCGTSAFTCTWSAVIPSSNPEACDTDGSFDFDMQINWTSNCPGYWEAATMTFLEDPDSVNIDELSVMYTPDLLTLGPNCACGSWTINAEGSLDNETLDGVLKTKATFVRSGATCQTTKTVNIEEGGSCP